jgi:signal transduction histidine kinase
MTDVPRDSQIEHIKLVERLVTGLVHDLNNPLAGIIGYAQLARTEGDVDRRTRFLDSIKQQADTIKESLSDLLHIAVSTPPPADVVTAAEIVGMAQLRMRSRIDLAGVRFESDAPKLLPPTRGDADALARALTKLIDNALLAVRSAGSPVITVTARFASSWLVIEVEDNGSGFSQTMAERAFDPTATSRRTGNGVGLGLPVALSVARRHGGLVEIASAEEVSKRSRAGVGAIVRILLPAVGLTA